jgi:hypothetical protein
LRLSTEKHARFGEADPLSRRVWTPWLLRRPAGEQASLQQPRSVLESSPFYHRGMSVFGADGQVCHEINEYLDLRRFSRRTVRAMLRYRTYRRPGLDEPPLRTHVSAREVFPDDPV